MSRNINTARRSILLLLLATTFLFIPTQQIFAVTYQVTEELTTTTYKDAANTTAIWDTQSGGHFYINYA
jgi:hypothetical protein